MKKFLIFTLIGVAIIGGLISILIYLNLRETKSLSPEEQVVFNKGNTTLKVLYNRPYKKGRDIFGALVPYEKVWRTGANEATTFETNTPIKVKDKELPSGKYSLWTIPGKDKWTIIFNSEYGQWGINSEGQANRSPDKDVLSVEVVPVEQDQVFEQLTISFEKSGDDNEMVIAWDKTIVAIPISL